MYIVKLKLKPGTADLFKEKFGVLAAYCRTHEPLTLTVRRLVLIGCILYYNQHFVAVIARADADPALLYIRNYISTHHLAVRGVHQQRGPDRGADLRALSQQGRARRPAPQVHALQLGLAFAYTALYI